MIAAALLLLAAAMVLVRLGWAGRRGVAAGGWILASAALVALVWRDGAWGLAMGTVVAITVALSIVLYAGWITEAKLRRPAREAPSVTVPRRPREILRRACVFMLVVPVAFVAAQWLAFGVQALARRGGAGEADATVLTLFLQPILWTLIMAWQMTRASASRMVVPPIGAAVVGTLLWSLS